MNASSLSFSRSSDGIQLRHPFFSSGVAAKVAPPGRTERSGDAPLRASARKDTINIQRISWYCPRVFGRATELVRSVWTPPCSST